MSVCPIPWGIPSCQLSQTVASSDKFGMNFERYCTVPQKLQNLLLSTGLGRSMIDCTLSGSGLAPSFVKIWPCTNIPGALVCNFSALEFSLSYSHHIFARKHILPYHILSLGWQLYNHLLLLLQLCILDHSALQVNLFGISQ